MVCFAPILFLFRFLRIYNFAFGSQLRSLDSVSDFRHFIPTMPFPASYMPIVLFTATLVAISVKHDRTITVLFHLVFVRKPISFRINDGDRRGISLRLNL